MSLWYDNVELEDIDLDGDEVNILFHSDNQGNHYVSVKADLLRQKLKLPLPGKELGEKE